MIEALGENVILLLPSQTQTEGGILLPDQQDQDFEHARVESIGGAVKGAGFGTGDLVLYEKNGVQHVDDTTSKVRVAVHYSMVIARIQPGYCKERGLPIPDKV